MRKLTPPVITHSQVLLSCISNIRNNDLLKNVKNNLQAFEDASNIYNVKGENGCLHQLDTHNSVASVITKDEMIFLYNKMVNKRNPARNYYDVLLHQSVKCPYCGYGSPTTLDHFLPKTHFPIYAVDPLNLVPCCRDCNSTKLDEILEDGNSLLHPYYDNFDNERWLYCEIGYFETLAFNFTIKKPTNWSEVKFKKLQQHFKLFQLNKLFIGFASDEFADSIFEIKNLYDLHGPDAVKDNLQLKFESCNYNLKNHWKTALYYALKKDDNFYDWISHFNLF
ncbi:HNH endonuclease [Bacillus cereus]|nr:HNH endonuclease [Bacillus cereus]MCU5143226.1 HNH endonuclease [Bacillus cereus]